MPRTSGARIALSALIDDDREARLSIAQALTLRGSLSEP
jgi:hypothetical protein